MTAGTGTLETFDAPLGATVVQDTAVVLRAGRISLEIGAFTGALIDGKGWQGALRYAP